jgi:hypothetical protein
LEDELGAVVQAGDYQSQEEAIRHALAVLLAAKPSLRINTAVELYSRKKVTLTRAAEIAGLALETCKAYRPEYLHAWAGGASHTQITLSGLAQTGGAAMVRAVLTRPCWGWRCGLPPRMLQRGLAEQAQGGPPDSGNTLLDVLALGQEPG